MWNFDLEPTNDCPKGAKVGHLGPENCIFYYDCPIIWTEQNHRFLVYSLDATCGDWSIEDQTCTITYGEHTTVLRGPQWLHLVAELTDEDQMRMRPENHDTTNNDLRNRLIRDAKGIWIVFETDKGIEKSWRVQYEDVHQDFLPFAKEI